MFEFSHDALDKICVEQKIDLWGIAPTALLNDEVAFLEKWLSEGKHGDMHWLEDHLELRRNPAEMFAGTQSILMIGISYYSAETEIEQEAGNNSCRVAKYVTKVDYHHYLKKLLYSILKELQKINPDTEGRPFTDSAPVMEKVWAQKAGLGWIGKNSLLINKRFGSYVFLGGLMLNCTFDSYDKQEKNNCGSCNACQNNCPTNALNVPHVLEANKCINYYTIENRDKELSSDIHLDGWIYGCDSCQVICPWNLRLSESTHHSEMRILTEVKNKNKKWWKNLGKSSYNKLVKRTAMSRQDYERILRNIEHNEKKQPVDPESSSG